MNLKKILVNTVASFAVLSEKEQRHTIMTEISQLTKKSVNTTEEDKLVGNLTPYISIGDAIKLVAKVMNHTPDTVNAVTKQDDKGNVTTTVAVQLLDKMLELNERYNINGFSKEEVLAMAGKEGGVKYSYVLKELNKTPKEGSVLHSSDTVVTSLLNSKNVSTVTKKLLVSFFGPEASANIGFVMEDTNTVVTEEPVVQVEEVVKAEVTATSETDTSTGVLEDIVGTIKELYPTISDKQVKDLCTLLKQRGIKDKHYVILKYLEQDVLVGDSITCWQELKERINTYSTYK